MLWFILQTQQSYKKINSHVRHSWHWKVKLIFLSFRKLVTIQNEFYYTTLVGQSGLDGKVRKRKSFPLNTQCWSWRRELWLETGNTGVCKRCNKLRSETSSRWKTGFVARSMPAPGCSLELISSDFFFLLEGDLSPISVCSHCNAFHSKENLKLLPFKFTLNDAKNV